MNQNQDTPAVNRASGAALGFLVAGVLFAVLAVIVKFSVNVPAIDADRDAVHCPGVVSNSHQRSGCAGSSRLG